MKKERRKKESNRKPIKSFYKRYHADSSGSDDSETRKYKRQGISEDYQKLLKNNKNNLKWSGTGDSDKMNNYWKNHDLTKFGKDPVLTQKIRSEVFSSNIKELESAFIDKGVAPIFGYPLLSYSPRAADEYWQMLVNPIVSNNQANASVYEVLHSLRLAETTYDKM